MAKLGSYYALCPLIDVKSILGVSSGIERGVVIATLGKNISSLYKISDQKQIACWRTKDKFSSPVIYDRKSSKYVAVFNHSTIKMWVSDDNLDKVKKYKFNHHIHTLFENNGNSFVIFNKGAIYRLEDAIEQRKTLHPEELDINQIEDVFYKELDGNLYVGLLVRSEDCTLYWAKYYEGRYTFSKSASRDQKLKGYCFHSEGHTMNLLTLWSDGTIYSHDLENQDSKNESSDKLFSAIDSIASNHTVCMTSLNDDYIAMYGANSNEEGAVLIIYNTKFKVTQSRQPFKLFSDGAKVWCIDNNLFLPVGQHLATIPFVLDTEQLAALIGSHLQNETDQDVQVINEIEVGSWDKKFKLHDRVVPEILKPKIDEYFYQGLPESLIFEKLLPDILNKPDIVLLSICLKYFSDISEKNLGKILKFLITSNSKYFNGNECKLANLPSSLQPLERITLIDNVLQRNFSEILLLPYLRAELSLDDVILLLNYICILCSEDGCVLPSMNFVQTEAKLIEWSCILIDSNYQKIVISNDEAVQQVLSRLDILIQNHLQSLEELKIVAPLLHQLERKKPLNQSNDLVNLRYSIEQFSFY